MNELQYLAQAYFHQDYDLEAETPIDLIRQFRETEPPDSVAQLGEAVQAMLLVADEKSLRDLWLDHYNACYEPDRDGMTYREWFERVLEVLREAR